MAQPDRIPLPEVGQAARTNWQREWEAAPPRDRQRLLAQRLQRLDAMAAAIGLDARGLAYTADGRISLIYPRFADAKDIS